MLQFSKATKRQVRLRLAIVGPSGSGKTYTALRIAASLGDKVALIDTERGSASKYADEFEFDVLELSSFDPKLYIEAIQAAQKADYDVLIIDSLSHAWAGTDGLLEQHDQVARRRKDSNTWAAWRDVTPLHNRLIDTMLSADLHIITTMRSKVEYVVEQDSRGKMVPRKVGLAPVQRAGMEYEFDVVADMDLDHNFVVSKTRCPSLDGKVVNRPDGEVSQVLKEWLTDGTPPPTLPPGWDRPEAAKSEAQEANENGDKHWIDDPAVRKRFWGFTHSLGLTRDEVHTALCGKPDASVRDFADDMNAAKALLEDFATWKDEQTQEQDAA